jgi:hypothetical protein
VHNQEHRVNIVKRKPNQGLCTVLAMLERGGRLVPVKLGVLSKPMRLEPMRYDARVLAKETKEA